MIDHISFVVSDYERSKRFYLAALEPLGYAMVMELKREDIPQLPAERIAGLGAEGKPDFWIREIDTPMTLTHVAFRAKTHAEVDAFHRAAIDAGGRSNGEPGPRPHYHPSYYGAFVLDPDGHNIEAVCHTPQ